MFALLYDTGARVQELILLRPCDLHLESPAYLICREKETRTELFPFMKNRLPFFENISMTTNYIGQSFRQSHYSEIAMEADLQAQVSHTC